MQEKLAQTSSTTTTIAFGKLRGLSLDIIFVLCEEGKAMRTIDIANVIGKPRKLVYEYLRRMARKGLVNCEQGLWLTLGSADKIFNLLKGQQKDNTKITKRQHQDNTKTTVRQINIDLWINQYNPSEAEEVVVNALVEHYNRTGQAGLLLQNPYDYYEHGIHLSPEDFNKARISLQNEGIITWGKYKDKAAWKIALKKDFLMRLKEFEK